MRNAGKALPMAYGVLAIKPGGQTLSHSAFHLQTADAILPASARSGRPLEHRIAREASRGRHGGARGRCGE
ncbi:hypothetical protein GCM10008179_17910 [Hansschlegelia plantiphila]|uniref:Uncharacterized protein n=1 Tax=Hansschlegelia plantiphila TaxID=374655 RepID=A0A9W6J2F5_9HYPH|nr:hypothetical protein GCM10008179_17910 [Hansschlegelia plantiphila]